MGHALGRCTLSIDFVEHEALELPTKEFTFGNNWTVKKCIAAIVKEVGIDDDGVNFGLFVAEAVGGFWLNNEFEISKYAVNFRNHIEFRKHRGSDIQYFMRNTNNQSDDFKVTGITVYKPQTDTERNVLKLRREVDVHEIIQNDLLFKQTRFKKHIVRIATILTEPLGLDERAKTKIELEILRRVRYSLIEGIDALKGANIHNRHRLAEYDHSITARRLTFGDTCNFKPGERRLSDTLSIYMKTPADNLVHIKQKIEGLNNTLDIMAAMLHADEKSLVDSVEEFEKSLHVFDPEQTNDADFFAVEDHIFEDIHHPSDQKSHSTSNSRKNSFVTRTETPKAASAEALESIELDDSVYQLPVVGHSDILSDKQLQTLIRSVPARHHFDSWKRYHSTDKQGVSLKNFFRCVAKVKTSVIIIRDDKKTVFGVYGSNPWHVTPRHYYGDGECFVYHFSPEFRKYQATFENDYYQLSTAECIGMGGGNHLAFYLDHEMFSGSSGTSETFNNPCLTKTPDFCCLKFELWGPDVNADSWDPYELSKYMKS